MKYTYEQIEALLLLKDFEELSAQQKAGVGLSASAYAQQQRVLKASQQVLSTPPAAPPANALPSLKKQFEQQYARPAFWQFSIPIYQVALLLLLCGVGTWYFFGGQQKETVTIKEKIVYVPQLDTVVQEQLRIEKKIIYRVKEVPIIQLDTVYLLTAPTEQEREQFYQEKKENAIFAKESKGKSMKQMNGLMDFVVGTE